MSTERAGPEPLRPSVATLAWLVVALWSGIVAAQAASWSAYAAGQPVSVLTGSVGMASVVCAVVLGVVCRKRRVVVIVAAGWVAGVVLASLFWGHWAWQVSALTRASSGAWHVEVLSDESVTAFGSSSSCRVDEGPGRGARVTVQWPKDVAAPALGQRVRVWGRAKAPTSDARGLRSARSGVAGTVSVRRVDSLKWAPSIRGVIGRVRVWAVARTRSVDGPGGDLLAGVVIGDRRRLAGTVADTDFRTTGLTHLVAVSGSHLVVVAMVVGWAAAAMGMHRTSRAALAAMVVGSYVVFSGVQPSAVRAWAMATAASVSWLSGRRVDGGSALAVAAASMLLLSPVSAFDLGFQLSVAAVAGLVFFARLTEWWTLAATDSRGRWVLSPIALTLTATAATLPITVSTFGSLSLVSPLANVIAGPLVSAALVVGLAGLAASAFSAPVGSIVLRLAAVPSGMAVAAAHWLAGWPHAAVPLGLSAGVAGGACAAVGVCVWSAWPRPTPTRARFALAAAACGLLLLAVGPPAPRGARIEVLDVGQGDAILVQEGRHAILVDAGPSSSAMRAALARASVRALDAVVITHLHADHYGGLGGLEGLVKVPVVFVASGALDAHSPALDVARRLAGRHGVRELSGGMSLRLEHLVLDVVWPREEVEDAATNEASVVLRAREGGFSALLTGDAEADVLDQLVGDETLGDIDVLKVGHHGSAAAVSQVGMRTLRPEWALISVGRGNRFGHPTGSTMRLLAESGSRVVRTDQSGDVTVNIDERGEYDVRVARRGTMAARGRPTRWVRGLRGTQESATMPCARAAFELTEPHGQGSLRVQTHLPHLRRARPPPGARAGEAQGERG